MARPKKVIEEVVETFESDPRVQSAENPTLAKAKVKSKTVKQDLLYPPKMRKFTNMKFLGMEMSEVFNDKIIKHADFTDADLTGADFSGFILQGSVFKNSNLTDVDFTGADLRWSKFVNCEGINTADFTDADINEVEGL